MNNNIKFGEPDSNSVAKILANNRIENETQIVGFISYVYRLNLKHYTDSLIVSDKNQLLRNQNIDFLNQDPERKSIKELRVKNLKE